MNDAELVDEVHKRLTLNWLIQGAAVHMGQTLHYLVRDELIAVDPRLVRLYDHLAIAIVLQHWMFEGMLIFGRPARFWRRVARSPRHPFHAHRLLSRYGGELAEAERLRTFRRADEKGIKRRSLAFSWEVYKLMRTVRDIETPHRRRLVWIAKRAAAQAWGVPPDRFRGKIVDPLDIRRDRFTPPSGFRAKLFLLALTSWSAVNPEPPPPKVEAEAGNGCLLAAEFVKGTGELICLHGLNRLDDDAYAHVMREADLIQNEPWMIQTGGELWRRVLAALPSGRRPAEMLMHLARLAPAELESVMEAIIERRPDAAARLAVLGAT